MQNLLRLLIRYNFHIVFIILELIALSLVVQKNPVPRSKFFSMVESVNGFVYQQFNRLGSYLGLRAENDRLVLENARLKYQLDQVMVQATTDMEVPQVLDSLDYDLLDARVINHSVNKIYNYLTLNRGSLDGIKEEMGVIGPDGIVGIVRNVSKHYSSVISVLNPEFRASVRLKSNDFLGTLQWDARNYREGTLVEIPAHASVQEGDTVITSGFSTLFPEGMMVGTVQQIDLTPAGNFYDIRLLLSQDMKRLSRVYIIRSYTRAEQVQLETLNHE